MTYLLVGFLLGTILGFTFMGILQSLQDSKAEKEGFISLRGETYKLVKPKSLQDFFKEDEHEKDI